jgi:predicted TIM-barrel fold metal-dependent hydrolase
MADTEENIRKLKYPGAIDADGHILESPRCWEEYCEAKYRAKAIRLREEKDGLEYLEVNGVPSRVNRGGTFSAVAQMGQVKRNPSYHKPVFDRFWAAPEEIGLPIGVHSGAEDAPLRFPRDVPFFLSVCNNKMFMMQQSLALLISSAVPQRFRKLRFVIVEGGIGWIAALLRFMDHWWEDHHRWMEPKLDKPPSACFKRQFWATFEDDRPGVLTRHLLGTDRLMWGSDYPHTEGTFPFSMKRISQDFVDVPEDETRMMVRNNAAHLYGID